MIYLWSLLVGSFLVEIWLYNSLTAGYRFWVRPRKLPEGGGDCSLYLLHMRHTIDGLGLWSVKLKSIKCTQKNNTMKLMPICYYRLSVEWWFTLAWWILLFSLKAGMWKYIVRRGNSRTVTNLFAKVFSFGDMPQSDVTVLGTFQSESGKSKCNKIKLKLNCKNIRCVYTFYKNCVSCELFLPHTSWVMDNKSIFFYGYVIKPENCHYVCQWQKE